MKKFLVILNLWLLLLFSHIHIAFSKENQGVIPSPDQNSAILAAPVISAATTSGNITFDDYPINTSITNQYETQGVVFDPSFIELDSLPSILYLSGDNESYPTPYGNGQNAAPITAYFKGPTNFVEADPIYLDMGSIMTIQVFDKNSIEIGSVSGSSRLRVDANGIMKAVFSFSNPNKIDDIAGIDNLAFDPAPTVSIDSADLVANNISVTLSGLRTLTPAPLDIELVGNNGSFKTTFNNGENVGDGTYAVKLDRPSIPADIYTKIIATWKLSSGDVISQDYLISPVWRVLGLIRHSQYNTPTEIYCSGRAETAWVFDTACNFTKTTLDSKFAKQTYINGTGRSIQHGIIKNSTLCSNSRPNGANRRNAFLLVNEITGICNKVMTDSYQAAYPNPHGSTTVTPKCGDNTVLVETGDVNKAEKQIQDYCPVCKDGHIDNYTLVEKCKANEVGDLGDFWTANVGRQ